ncbi:hypothetical protein [Bacillus sp. FSL K6-6540]|uniref:hypothetical protein n=1 Tax=Bacillus sp. FSL K6-6540 TaxID=2921512 RepID=UPI0030FA4E99
MQHLIPIQITLQAANAADAKQLVQDLAGTMSSMPAADVPAETKVSTVQPEAVAAPPAYAPPGQAYPSYPPAGQPGTGATNSAPAVPTAPPVAAPTSAPASYNPPAQPVPTSAPTYDLTQLGVAAQPLLDAGRHAELIGWLQQHGAQALTQLDPQYYGEFATYLRSLGAKI